MPLPNKEKTALKGLLIWKTLSLNSKHKVGTSRAVKLRTNFSHQQGTKSE